MKCYLIPFLTVLHLGCRTTHDESSDVRIADGEVVAKNDPISTVTVALLGPQKEFLCSGSIISEDIVLSAAHCKDPSFIRLGRADLQEANPSFQMIEVSGSDNHPCYDYRTTEGDRYGFDLKIVRLKNPVPANWPVNNNLPDDQLQIPLESELVGSGFGATSSSQTQTNYNVLRKATFASKTDQTFSQLLIHMVGGPGRVFGRSLCYGDSGGPTFLVKDQKLIQIGVNSGSAGDPQVTCMDGSRIVDLRAHKKWILETVKNIQNGAPLETANNAWCKHVSDETKGLKPFGDGETGKGSCRIPATWDKDKAYLQAIGSGPDPSCPSDGGAGGFAPALRAYAFSVSAPKDTKSVYLCSEAEVDFNKCISTGVKIPRDSENTGSGRECFTYVYQSGDKDRSGRFVLESVSGMVATDIKLNIGYHPCDSGGGI
jgi:hypothetical protein